MKSGAVLPEYRIFGRIAFPMRAPLLPFVGALLRAGTFAFRFPKDLRVRRFRIPGGGGPETPLTLLEPAGIGSAAPCLLYLHGGAFALPAAPLHLRLVSEYARRTPCKAILVDYRLAPKRPFPAGAEDCGAALRWVTENAGELGIDRERIALGGDSAGGALAAAACRMELDRGGKPPRFLMLVYPVADARQATESMKTRDTPLWNAEATERMWALYLKNGCPAPRAYASPLEAESFSGFPDAYVEVAECDCLRDEGIALADALRRGGARVELQTAFGAPHGFEILRGGKRTRSCVERRIRALREAFAAQ